MIEQTVPNVIMENENKCRTLYAFMWHSALHGLANASSVGELENNPNSGDKGASG